VQADERSHAFNYRSLARSRADGHLLGLPVIRVPDGADLDGARWSGTQVVHMEYLLLGADLAISPQGSLSSRDGRDDRCVVSCADWYGDSRPFFIDERLYALLVYELVQGDWTGGSIQESGRAKALDLLD
jgi:hypothetical protein